MNRHKILIICILGLLVLLTGCGKYEKTVPVDARYIPEHEEIQTTYQYKLDILGDSTFKLMPNIHTVIVPEKYEVCYKDIYDSGQAYLHWKEVDYTTYISTCAEIGKDAQEGGTK